MSRQICYIQYYFILSLLSSLVISISIIITNYYLYHNNHHIISTNLYVLNRAHSSSLSISQRTVHVLCVTTTNFSYLIFFFQITCLPTFFYHHLSSSLTITCITATFYLLICIQQCTLIYF